MEGQIVADKLVVAFEKYLLGDLARLKRKVARIEKYLDLIEELKRCHRSVEKPSAESSHEKVVDKPLSAKSVNLWPLYLNSAIQYYMVAKDAQHKEELMTRLFATVDVEQSIVYCNSLNGVRQLTRAMTEQGFRVMNLIGMKAMRRQKVVEELNSGDLWINGLIAVRPLEGLRNVSLYVNFDLPKKETYLKRVGSIRRNVYKYLVLNLVTEQELRKLLSMVTYYQCHIQPMPLLTDIDDLDH